jgi:hypothetical protein
MSSRVYASVCCVAILYTSFEPLAYTGCSKRNDKFQLDEGSDREEKERLRDGNNNVPRAAYMIIIVYGSI